LKVLYKDLGGEFVCLNEKIYYFFKLTSMENIKKLSVNAVLTII